MRRRKVYLLGGDQGGWALDTELRLARQALSRLPDIEIVGKISDAEILHTVWPEQLIERKSLRHIWQGRTVVASFSNDPLALFRRVPGLFNAAQGWVCVGQSTSAFNQLRAVGLKNVEQVSYRVDDSGFFPIKKDDPRIVGLKAELGIEAAAYVIGFFQRDSQGNDLSQIKVQKAPDFFLGIAHELSRRHPGVHFLLAGPRRHWIRNELNRLGVRFSFYGNITEGDDFKTGVIPREAMNLLVNCCDLNIVTSRWEGAPRAIMESIAAGKKVVSTPVGIAEDLLGAECIFRNLPEALRVIGDDLRENSLDKSIDAQKKALFEHHGLDAVSRQWGEIYGRIGKDRWPVAGSAFLSEITPAFESALDKAKRRLMNKFFRSRARFAWLESSDRSGRWVNHLDQQFRLWMNKEFRVSGASEADLILVDGLPENLDFNKSNLSKDAVVVHRWNNFLLEDSRAEIASDWNLANASYTLFQTSSDWIEATKRGCKVVSPRVANQLVPPIPGQVGRMNEKAKKVGVLGSKLALDRFVRVESAEDLSAIDVLLLVDDTLESRAAATLCQASRIPVIFPERTGVAEICGFGGIGFAGHFPEESKIQEALSFRESIVLACRLPEPEFSINYFLRGLI